MENGLNSSELIVSLTLLYGARFYKIAHTNFQAETKQQEYLEMVIPTAHEYRQKFMDKKPACKSQSTQRNIKPCQNQPI